jgi:hypothetical protein
MIYCQLLVLTLCSPSDTAYTLIFPETGHANWRELVRSLYGKKRMVATQVSTTLVSQTLTQVSTTLVSLILTQV